MGFFFSKKSNFDNANKNWYFLEEKDAKAMKNLWKVVENDPSYYGRIFSGILFRNHPQYVKYFHDDKIPEFVEDATIKKKFSAICCIVSVLFINYLKKPNQRDHVLSYIAMIHKDMQLSTQDLENFMMDLLEMLTQERPIFINNRFRNLIIQYFSGLLRRIEYLMEVYRMNDILMMERLKKSQKRYCGFKCRCDSPKIFGSSIEFWMAKKEYWQNKVTIWYPHKKNSAPLEKAEKVHRTDNIKFNLPKETSNFISRDRKHSLSQATIETTNLERTKNHFSHYDVKTREKDRRYYKRHAMALNTAGPMQVISEDSSSDLINVKSSPRRKSSPKNTQAFLDAVEALKTSTPHSQADLYANKDKGSNGSSTKRSSIIDAARERKRARDKKFNPMHSTSDLRQMMDSKTLITGKAEKFAEALAKRRGK